MKYFRHIIEFILKYNLYNLTVQVMNVKMFKN